MNKSLLRLGLFLVLLTPGWAMKPMAWEKLMQVKAAAEKGDPEAQFLFGLQLKEGDGIDKDRREAVKWLRKAAESGHAEAQYTLGDFYAGLDPADELADLREAEKWLKAAAAQGNADAQARLARLPAKGAVAESKAAADSSARLEPVEVTEDPAVTVRWSLLLSGLRGAEAWLVRGFLLENGIYVNRDAAAATDNYRQAAKQGDARARARVRAASSPEGTAQAAHVAQEHSGEIVKEDPAETAKWSLLLSGLRGADALLVRGFVLENGIHLPRDLPAAADNYRQAAALGDARGQRLLGLMPTDKRDAAKDTIKSPTKAGAVEGIPEKLPTVRKP